MSGGAIFMLVFGSLTLYGGLALCLRIAFKTKPTEKQEK